MLKAHFNKQLWYFNLEISLELDKQILVLWGPSGSGKTTILHCLAGLLAPTAGTIQLNDRCLYSSANKVNVAARHRNIGYLFQDYALFPHKTVKENVYYGLKCQKPSRRSSTLDPLKVLEFSGVKHLQERYPRQLSGGERQRVALARALVLKPEMLLLDEPFSALDRDIKRILRQEVKSLHEKWRIPFVMVSHDEEDASFFGDKVIRIDKGQIREIA